MKRTPVPVTSTSTNAQKVMLCIDSAGWTQADLSSRLGVSPVTVSRWRAQARADDGDGSGNRDATQPDDATVQRVLQAVSDHEQNSRKNVIRVRMDGWNYLAEKGDDGVWKVFELAFGTTSRKGDVTWESWKIETSEPERTEVLQWAGLVD